MLSYKEAITEATTDISNKNLTSAGIAITCKGMILLVRGTGIEEWSIPKGGVEAEDENTLESALRELEEEVGLSISREKISNPDSPERIEYTSTMNGRKKTLLIYICPIQDWSEIGIQGPYIKSYELQEEEIDVAIFLTREQAEFVITPRQKKLLQLVNF
jgi:8-oxo-dGTP pyrophosphatase MutT (NUDIX family)